MSTSSDPPTRRERREQTRLALVHAARSVFSRDGYHAANLDGIAREAGFSKGAVYSNFDGKADLFLAVTDLNIAAVRPGAGADPFEALPGFRMAEAERFELAEAIRGFSLATLEFIAVAARDEHLLDELSSRIRVLAGGYADVAEQSRAGDERLSVDELSTLLVALDQGFGVLALGGGDRIDQRVLREGMRRLLNPARSLDTDEDLDSDLGSGDAAFHDQNLQRGVARSIRPEAGEQFGA